MPHLGGGAHGGFAPAARQALLNRHGGRDAIHGIHLGPPGGLDDAAGVGVERLQVTALAFVEHNVKRQRGFARAAHAGNHVELAVRNLHAQVFQVVLFGVNHFDSTGRNRDVLFCRFCVKFRPHLGHAVPVQAQGLLIVAQRLRGVRAGHLPQLFGRALGDDVATAIAPLRPQVNQPIAGANHVQVVLNHDQAVPGLQQLAQRAHELGDVFKVQAGGRLVKQKQRAFAGQALARFGLGFGRFGQKTGEFEALRLAAGQGGHALAQLHIVQPHIHDGLQGADHLGILGEQLRGLGHGQRQHVGHIQQPPATLQAHLQHLGAVALAVAVGAAQVHVA